MPEIVKLNRTCGRDRPHGQCHGISAKASSYYTPAFAAEVGRVLIEKIDEQNVVSGRGMEQIEIEECHRPEEDPQHAEGWTTAGRSRCRRHGAAAAAPRRNIETSKIAGIEKERQLGSVRKNPLLPPS
eukprot:5906887-Heterocapsa_arctica.AAC.1